MFHVKLKRRATEIARRFLCSQSLIQSEPVMPWLSCGDFPPERQTGGKSISLPKYFCLPSK